MITLTCNLHPNIFNAGFFNNSALTDLNLSRSWFGNQHIEMTHKTDIPTLKRLSIKSINISDLPITLPPSLLSMTIHWSPDPIKSGDLPKGLEELCLSEY
eukprot:gene21229-25503_t